jgi:hypothetical protein
MPLDGIRRIIANAVYGRKAQTFRKIIRVTAEQGDNNPDVLGCSVCGVEVLGSSLEDDAGVSKKVKARVKFDIHIWYRSENDTKVAKISTEFQDHIEVGNQGTEDFKHEQVRVWIKEEPKCMEPVLIGNPEGDQIAVEVEYVLEAEIIGEALLKLRVFDT